MTDRDTIRTVAVAGDPFAMGAALGEAVAEAVHAKVLDHPRVRDLVEAHAGTERVEGLERAARATYPDYVRELEGLAAGA